MIDLYFSVVFLLTVSLVGLPVARLMPERLFPWRTFAAPVLGFVLVGVTATLIYLHDGSIRVFIYLAVGIAAICGLAEMVSRYRIIGASATLRNLSLTVGTAFLLLLLSLAPKWTGGARFAAFQGNHYDQLYYMTQVATFRDSTYGALPSLSEHQPLISEGRDHVYTRPAAPIIVAAFSKALNLDTIEATYPYLASLQTLTFFALAFLIAQVFTPRIEVVLFCAAAGTLGFPMQYLFDINAWGKLAGMPVALAGLALLLTTMMPPPGYTVEKRPADLLSIAVFFVIVVAGAIYYYPEMIPLYGCAAFGATLAWLVVTRRQLELANLLPALVGLVAAALGYLFFGQGALGFFIREVIGPVGAKVDWWKYFQAYLITRPTDFPSAAIGLYFILPPKLPALVAVPWRLSVYLLTAAVLISATVAWARADVSRNRAVLLLSGTLCTLSLIAATALTGRFWWAGSGLAMLAPDLFVVLVSPLLLPRAPKACRLVGLSFAGLYIAFGLARPICAANDSGVAYSWPYPGAQDRSLKIKFDWDVRRLATALEPCKVLALDVDNCFLERYLAVYLTDHGRPWTSTHTTLETLDEFSRRGADGPDQRKLEAYLAGCVSDRPRPAEPIPEGADCVLTDGSSIPRASRKVISMASDRRLLDYWQASTASLEIGVTSPAGVGVRGAYEVESYHASNLRWTSAKTHFLVPNNPKAPAAAIDLTAWPVAPGRHMTVTINGLQVYNGPIPRDSVSLDWKVADRSADLIDIGIDADAIHVPADARNLGVALRSLAVSR